MLFDSSYQPLVSYRLLYISVSSFGYVEYHSG